MSRRRVDNSIFRKKVLREQTAKRLEEWRSLSPVEQLQALDNRLGAGVGATKQRARLSKLIGSDG